MAARRRKFLSALCEGRVNQLLRSSNNNTIGIKVAQHFVWRTPTANGVQLWTIVSSNPAIISVAHTILGTYVILANAAGLAFLTATAVTGNAQVQIQVKVST